MTVIDNTARGQTDTVSLELDLRHRPEKVWRAITDPVLLEEWLLPATGFTLEPGGAFTLQAPSFPDWDGTVRCRVVEVEQHRRLRYTWVVGEMELDTVVTFTLTPTDTGTRLSLEQSGFKPTQKQNFGGARYGLKMMSEKLVVLLDKLS